MPRAMPLHLYALVEEPARLPDLAGVGGAGLSSVDGGGIAAIVSAASDNGRTEDAVLAHAAVVERAAHLNDPVLPVRFGRPLADAAEVLASVAERRSQIEA